MTPLRQARIERVELRDVRTYERLSAELPPGLTVLVGPNGIGKTNLLEACAMVLAGASPRTSAELRLIRHGQAQARIAARVLVDGDAHEREVRLDAARGKQLVLDGSTVRSQEQYAAQAPTLTFLPERLLVIRGAPARRRALLDQLAARVEPAAASAQRDYARAVQQRNALLRRAKAGQRVLDQIEPWTSQLVEHGDAVRTHRSRLLERLAAPFAERLQQLTGLTEGSLELELRGGEDLEVALRDVLELDLRRGTTGAGPHLDELTPRQEGRDLRAFGSTGEQRAALLAFTFAARDVVAAATGIEPVLLLDEPWAELDQDRRRRLSDLVRSFGQVLATTTEPPMHLQEAAGGPEQVDIRAVSCGRIDAWPATTSPTSPI